MLELKINKKDISLDPFEIVAWEDQELALALFATKPIGKEEDRVSAKQSRRDNCGLSGATALLAEHCNSEVDHYFIGPYCAH